MSHFDEMTCLLYLERQLDRERAAELSKHIDSCADCRKLLSALESESRLLRSALTEEEEAVPARVMQFAPEPTARETAPLAWLATLGFASAGAFTVWSWFLNPTLQQLSQAGFGGDSFLAMLFFGGVFWKGWDAMVNLTELLAAVTLVVLAVALFRRGWRHTSTVAVVLGTLACLLILPATADAAEIRHQAEGVTVAKDEVVKNDLIAAGSSVKIEGTVEGDLIAFCNTLTVEGHVTGDVIAFAQIVRMKGTVDGNVRTFGHTVSFDGTVAKNVISFSQNFELVSNREIGGSLIVFAGVASQDGRVGRDLLSVAGQHNMDGYVGGASLMRGDKLTIGPSAEMLGRVQIKSEHQPSISDKAKFGAGKPEITIEKRRPDYTKLSFYWRQLLRWAGAFVFGLVLILLLPEFFRETVQNTRNSASAFGLVILPGFLIICIVACLTIVALPLGVISLLLWGIAWYGSQVFVGATLGEMMLGKSDSTGAVLGRMALGLVVVRVLSMFPHYLPLSNAGVFVLWLCVWILIGAWGMGALGVTIARRTTLARMAVS